jgi:hypothetical protein
MTPLFPSSPRRQSAPIGWLAVCRGAAPPGAPVNCC